ncbi:Hypothetical protein A7982_11617 [Minicystis rosea]|nr:Hypothetical protein A7982_11617 [Minicystis rosea]
MNTRTIPIFINGHKYDLTEATQTGAALKRLAGIPLTDVLFLQQPHEDKVIANETAITLQPGAHLHSQPPADYGRGPAIDAEALGVASAFDVLPQPDGWTFVVVHEYALPNGYQPRSVKLLVKLPPLFPEAQPDMFWLAPAVKTSADAVPAGASIEQALDSSWQRFSWHLKPGAWKPGVSTLRDFMRCIRARFERGN